MAYTLVYVIFFSYLCGGIEIRSEGVKELRRERINELKFNDMKKIFFLMVAAMMSLTMTAGENELLWDYTEKAPSASPDTKYADHPLYYNETVKDGTTGKGNGLNGIKMDGNGYATFEKAPVEGKLILSFGPRDNANETDLVVYTWTGAFENRPANVSEMTKIATTEAVTELGTKTIVLTAEQNNIYLVRNLKNQGVLQTIRFIDSMEDIAIPAVITFKDQNGKELGTIDTFVDSLFAGIPEDIAAKLPAVQEGYKFRGWFYTNGAKAKAGDKIEGNTTISAKVTPIEEAKVGNVFFYDFASKIFYIEDHDLITKEEDKITVTLSGGKSVVVVKSGGKQTVYQYDGDKSATIDVVGTLQSVALYFVLDFFSKDEATGYYIVPANDVASFLYALVQANATGNAKIFLPNGVYDLGETTLTTITANNISIIGQSMHGVIIKNAPDALKESIDQTATLKIEKNVSGTYLQDLTIKNELDYYKNDNGRAVCLQDCGTKTVCKNVKLLSHQDTYYSNLQGAVKYLEDCEIHGTVDFICGDGSVYFKNNFLYAEKRNKAGTGTDALTASNADKTKDKGYVFESCTVDGVSNFTFGRLWNNAPQCVFLNTTLLRPELLVSSRWTLELMSDGDKGVKPWPGQAGHIGEYGTKNANGENITPASNNKEFYRGTEKQTYETILTADEAAVYTMEYTLGSWASTAEAEAKQAECEKTAAEFEPNGIYLVEGDGAFAGIILGSEFMDKFAVYDGVNYTVRKANARGGFGKPAKGGEEEGIEDVQRDDVRCTKVFRDGKIMIERDGKKYSIIGAKLQ